jgi:predicted alpha/beta hydrolase family esterase
VLRRKGRHVTEPSASDAVRFGLGADLRGLVPLEPLPFRAIVVSSATDPYVDPARARQMAEAWGARLVEVGDAGHMNAESNLGDWPAGHRLLEELLATS